jgi:hypothetical protein
VGERGRRSSADLATTPLRVVQPTPPAELPAAPDHLSPTMREWCLRLVESYEFEPHHLKVLETAADSWDRLVQARPHCWQKASPWKARTASGRILA